MGRRASSEAGSLAFFAIATVIVMLFGMIPQPAFAETRPPVDSRTALTDAAASQSLAAASPRDAHAPAAVNAGPVPIQFFFIPFPEQHVQNAYKVITTQSGSAMTSVTSISVTANNTRLYYDHWEDGYELDVTNFSQSSTRLWGDGNTANGDVCPLVQPASLCANDVLQAGAVIVLRNDVPLPRNPANRYYDARDKVSATKVVTMARSVWYANTNPGTMLADASEVYDLSRWGTDYRLPIGEDLSAMSTYMFEYVTLLVMAAENGTTVNIDKDGDGTVDVTTTLNQGEAYQVSSPTVGDLKSNARVTSNKPIQADLATGDIGSNYEQRWFTLLPTDQAGSSYYAPVGTVTSSYPAAVFVYNPSQASSITVSYQTQAGTGSFNVAAKGTHRFAMPSFSGAHFWTAGGQPFMAVGANDTTTNSSASTQNQTYDWGYTLVPESNLTTRLAVGWAPGTGDVPPKANGSPVWVMATRPTTIYVDYDGNPATGPNTAPNGAKYDVSFGVAALASQRIYDPDKDQTGMRVFTTDGTLITGAWGEDGSQAAAGNPFLDVGYTVPPLPEIVVAKSMSLVTDVNGNGLVNPGDTIEYKISITNRSVVKALGIIVQDTAPTNSAYVANSTKIGLVSIPDDATGTPLPLDGAGYNIGDIDLGQTVEVTFRVTANLTGNYTEIVNAATVRDGEDTYIVEIHTPVTGKDKTSCSLKLTDASWAPVTVYVVNGTAYVEVNDNDRNIDAGAIDTIVALAQNPTTGDRENVLLTETGANTGVFRGSLPTSATAGQAVGDATLYARGGEQITASYSDPVNGDSCNASAVIAVPSQTKILYLSDPSQALDRVDPVMTNDTTTNLSAVLTAGGGGGTVSDNFESGGYGGNSGTVNWTGNWTEVNETDGAALGALLVGNYVPTNGSYALQVRTGTSWGGQTSKSIYRQANLAGASSATLSYNWKVGAAGGGSVGVYASKDGGTNWTLIKTHNLVALAAGSESLNLTSYVASNTRIRFDIDGTTSNDGIIGFDDVTITYGGAGSASATFTQSPAMASAFSMPAGGSVGVTAYVNVTSGTMPASPNITGVLKHGATTIATLTNPTYSGGMLTWNGALTSAVIVPAGQALVVEFTTAQSGVSFQIRYDSKDYPSRVNLPTTTVISLTGLGVYDAPYPGGNPVASPYPGQKVYVRVTATDPFGASDITSADLTLAGVAVTLNNTHAVASSGNTKTYEYAWTTPSAAGSCAVNAIVKEGFEIGGAAISDSASLPLECQFEDTGTPSVTEFTNGNNGPGTETYNPNQQVCVRVTDADQNLNPSVAETVTAIITSSSGDSETITLTETGPNTGIFTNCINASATGGGGTSDGTLNAPPGATLVVTYTDPNDPSDTSNDTATVTVQTPAMAIAKNRILPADGVAVVGEQVRFDVVVSNPGPTTLSTVSVTDNFPSSCLSYQSASIAPSSQTGSSLTWSAIGPIASGGSKTISIYFTAIAPCNPATNSAEATGKDQNNTTVSAGPVTAQVVTTKPSVTVSKARLAPSTGPVAVGSTQSFKIDITNNGTTNITSLPLSDQYSAACLTYLSASPAASGSGGGIVFWNNLGPLAAGASTSVTVNFQVAGPCDPATNVAVVDSAKDANGDPVPPANGTATVPTVALPPQVTVTKTLADPAGGVAYIDDIIVYQVEIKNTGTSNITSLSVTDTYDGSCQSFVSADVAPTGASSGQVTWSPLIPSQPPLLAGQTRTLTLTFKATGAKTTCINTASVSGKDEFGQSFGPLTSQASVQIPLRLSGTVFDDANGSKVQNGAEPGTNAGGLYVNLLDSANKVVAWAAVDADGTYYFPAVPPNASYTLQLTTNRGTVGQPAPAIALPSNWVTTGENAHGTPDATADSKLAVTVTTTDVTSQNFGIEQLPDTHNKSEAAQLNPGGTNQVQVPTLTGTDPEDGAIGTGGAFKIMTLPTNGTLYYNGSPVTAGQVITGYDPTKLTVDPNDGAVTVVFTYAARDAAGQFDPSPATVTMPFGTISLSGHVFDDADGSKVQNGTEAGTNAGGLYVNLLNAAGTTVVATTAVNPDGTYAFPNVAPNTSYVLQLTVNQGVIGQAAPAFGLPGDWVTTGENNNGVVDGTSDSRLAVSVGTSNVVEQNFGIERPPDSDNKIAAAQPNPEGTNRVPAPALSGTDPEDGAIGAGGAFQIMTLPTNGTLYYNGSPVTAGQTITNYDPAKLTVDPNDGAVTVTFTYAAVDKAGVPDPTPATVTMPFTQINLSGTVFDDANGNQIQNIGPEPGTNAGGLYVNLLDGTGTTVIATTTVGASGSFSFPNVAPNTSYVLQLTVNQGTVGQPAPAIALPANWVTTGENGANVPDGSPDSKLTVNVGTSSITSRNFGIEELPDSDNKTAAPQMNPGGTNQVQVPTLTGTDPEDGPITGVFKIVTLPTNGTLYYNGSPVTAGQVITGYDPTKLTVDPNDGVVTVVFTYAARDAAGQFDPSPATVTMPFTQISLSGHVFDDADGSKVQNGTEAGTNAGGLYVNLLNAAGTTVVATTAVNPDGTYAFPNVALNTSYVLQLTVNQGVIGQAAPAFGLPGDWVTTGENNNGVVDGTSDSRLAVSVGTSNVVEQNFGIERPPDSDNKIAAAQPNPEGTNRVPAPALSGTDPEDGAIGAGGAFQIMTLPTNGTLYYNGSPVTAGQTITNYDPAKLTVDPNDGAVTVTFTYAAVDKAGVPDPTPATVTMPFTQINLSGAVFDDADGSKVQNGTEPGTNTGSYGALWVNLLDANNKVLAVAIVNNDGTFSFSNVAPNTTYTLLLTKNAGTPGQPAPAFALPTGWVTTGENNNGAIDAAADSKLSVVVAAVNVTGQNFGIEKLPESDDKSAVSQTNPGGTVRVQVPTLTGSDHEDGALGAGNTFKVTSLPTNGTLYYNGVAVASNQVITGYDPTKLTVDPNDGTVTVVFTYAWRDAAGLYDPTPATVTMPFTVTPGLTLSKSLVGAPENLGNGVFRVTYRIEAQNSGDVELRKVQITDRLDQTFVGATSFTVFGKSATAPLTINPSFTGKSPNYDLLGGTDTLLVGATAVVTIVVDVTPGSKVGPYTNTAESVAETPTGTPVSSLSNPVPVTFDVISRIGVAKELVEGPTSNGDGSYNVTYQLLVVNLGDTTLTNVQVYEDLDAAFGAGKYTVEAKYANGLAINPSYTGAPPANLLTGSDALAAGVSRSIIILVKVRPGNDLGPYYNQARATATGPNGVLAIDTLSNNGTDPDTDDDRDPNEPIDDVPTPVTFPAESPAIGAAKALKSTTNNGDGTFTVVYEITVKNYGDIDLNNVQVTDNLATAFAGAAVSASVTSSQFTVNSNFNGTNDTNLLAAGNSLAKGATKAVMLTVTVRPSASPATYENQATAEGTSPGGTKVTDPSTAGVDPDNDGGDPSNDGDGDPTNNSDKTPVTVTQAPGIAVDKTGPTLASVGSTAVYSYAVTNTGDVRLGAVTVADNVCGAATYMSGDANANDYLDLTETWQFTCSYVVKPTDPDPLVNTATASGVGPIGQQVNATDIWSTRVQPFDLGDFVWWDVDGNGIQDASEPGIPGVTLNLYDGPCPVAGLPVGAAVQTTVTDAAGRYGFSALAGGSYCVAIDQAEFAPNGTLKDWTATLRDAGNDAIDSDGDSVTHATTATVAAGQMNDTIDFGFTIASGYTITKTLTSVNPSRLGEEITFEIKIVNTGKTWLSTLPLKDEYDVTYLTYGFGDKFAVPDTVDHSNDGTLNWTDLTGAAPHGFGGDIEPGGTRTVQISFTARRDTTPLGPNGMVNKVTVSNALADPDGPEGPLQPLAQLETHDASAGVNIYTPTGIMLEWLEATPGDGGVRVNWRTASESELLGFLVFRRGDPHAGFELVNDELILAEYAGQNRGSVYTLLDERAPAGSYTYRLDGIGLDGVAVTYGFVEVTVAP